jgi:hypothetical protein
MTSLEVPPTQSTAPVFEYRCLYTADIRRKQKRWQDGQLKFHTFNNRVMVYDERSNFVGDTHWREDELNEGAELELERRGILVEVGECTGQRNQDVSELVDKPRQEKEHRAASRAVASPVARHPSTPAGSELLRPKPLNQMLTPSGHYGRAVIPKISPFQEKQRQASRLTDESERPAKRCRQTEDIPSKSGYAQNLMGASLDLSSSRPPSTATIRYEPLKLKSSVVPKTDNSIDLTEASDNEHSVHVQQDGARPTNIQKREKRPPVRKNSYASNLTGAALSLSRPAAISSRLINKSQLANSSGMPLQRNDRDLSKSREDDSIMMGASDKQYPLNVENWMSRTSRNAESFDLEDMFNSRSSSPTTCELESVAPERPSRSNPPLILKSSSSYPRERQGKVQRRESSLGDPDLDSSSPPISQPTKPCKELGSIQHSTNQSSSTNTPGATRATSSLRIKPRPPRKMMMLMEWPGSRQSVSLVKPSGRTTPKSKERVKAANNDIVHSQATLKLDAFCKQQDERLQARLNGRRSIIDVDDFSDSSLDSNTDCGKIDLSLNHKMDQEVIERQQVPQPANQQIPTPSEAANYSNKHSDTEGILHSKNTTSEDSWTIPPESKPASCPKVLPEVTTSPDSAMLIEKDGYHQPFGMPTCGDTKCMDDLPEPVNSVSSSISTVKEISVAQGVSSTSDNDLMQTSERSWEFSAPKPINQRERLTLNERSPGHLSNLSVTENIGDLAVPYHAPRSQVLGNPFTGHSGSLLQEDDGSESERHVNQRLCPPGSLGESGEGRDDPKQREKDLLQQSNTLEQNNVGTRDEQENIISTVRNQNNKGPSRLMTRAEEAVAHLPAKLASSKSHPCLQQEVPGPHCFQRPQASDLLEVRMAISPPPNRKLSSSGLVLNLSPMQTTNQLNVLEEEIAPQNGNKSNASITIENSTKTVPQATSGTTPTGSENNPTRTRILNPATRGKSLQSIAAGTVDAPVPASNSIMPPPPLRRLNRANRSNPRDDSAIIRGRADATPFRAATNGGPWSRESFDLFGTWKPPQRNPSTNVTAV